MADILIFTEMIEGELQNSAKELIQAARKLSDQTDNKASVVLMGPNAITQSEIAIQFGAHKVYTMTNREFDGGNPDYRNRRGNGYFNRNRGWQQRQSATGGCPADYPGAY